MNPGGGADNSVNALAIQARWTNSKWQVILLLSRITIKMRIARLNSDGTVDETFNQFMGPNGSIKAIAVQTNGTILIGGSFTQVSLTNRAGIARFKCGWIAGHHF